jgi:hypothetical protein
MTTQTISRGPASPCTTAGNGSNDAAAAGRFAVLARRVGARLAQLVRTHSWLRTLFAATAALAVCVAAVVYTPIEAPTSWRSAGSNVSSVRHTPSE